MRGLVVVGEGYRDVAALAGSGADKLALEARNEALGAELEVMALCRPAVERSTVDLADEVDDHDIDLETGRAKVGTPVTNAHLGCRLLHEKKNITHAIAQDFNVVRKPTHNQLNYQY